MKKINLIFLCAAVMALLAGRCAWAGEVDILVTKLVEKGVLSPSEAQIVMDETKLQVSKDLAEAKSYSVPEWSQRIKWGGDVRYRTQGDWGKAGPWPQGNNPATLQEQRWRNRIRGRFYMEGKVNDFTYAGARFAGGGDNARSTNDTLGASAAGVTNYFRKYPVEFDQYYMRFEAPAEMRRRYGCYFSDLKLWAGRFSIPYEYSELVWDSDINPGGVALQYVSPDFRMSCMPDFNVYSNIGYYWLDEAAAINTDPLLFGFQVGMKTAPFGPFDSTLNISTAFYNFENMKDHTPNGAGTNSRNWRGDDLAGTPAGSTLPGTTKYEFNVFDLLVNIDNSKIGSFEFPHGFYGDFIYNAGCHDQTLNKGCLLGAYIGKKKLKEPGDWKLRSEWRYIERDAIPDFMPDSDFYGFGTYINTTTRPSVNGMPAEGGTNGKGINLAFEYQLFKNTTLNFEYYWMKPIKSWDKHNPWNELQLDVITKF